jgi:hypothetical protein
MASPLVAAAAGEHSHSTLSATSSGEINRSSTLSLASAARASDTVRPVLVAISVAAPS